MDVDFRSKEAKPKKTGEETHTYSGQDPSIRRLYLYDQDTVVLRSRALSVDSVAKFTLRVGGGDLGTLLEGNPQPISIVLLPNAQIQEFMPSP